MIQCPKCASEQDAQNQVCRYCGFVLQPGDDPAASSFLIPGDHLQNGRYVILEMLGQGGMGAVFLASDTHLLNKYVIVKELLSDPADPEGAQENIRNFIREAEMLASLHHPLIPTVSDHFQDGSHYFMVQEYVEGENLEERLQRLNQPMQEREVLQYASQVLEILDYLQQQAPPIVHRDIKPANIIIGAGDEQPHLVDFGIARPTSTFPTLRQQTSALGTPGYAPREQYQRHADPRSDLYALAATLHYLLTNADPARHAPFSYPLVRTLNPALSLEVEQMLDHVLANDPGERYQSAAEMKEAIDSILLNRFALPEENAPLTLKQPHALLQDVTADDTVYSPLPPRLPSRTPAPVRPASSSLTPRPGPISLQALLVILLLLAAALGVPWFVITSNDPCNRVSLPVSSGDTAGINSEPGSIVQAYYKDLQIGGANAYQQPGETSLYDAASYWTSDETAGGQLFDTFSFVNQAAAANANPISNFAVCRVTFTPDTGNNEATVVVAVVRSYGSSSSSHPSANAYAVTLTLRKRNGSWKIVGADGI